MNNDLGGILDTGPRHHFVAGWIAPDKINEVRKRVPLRALRAQYDLRAARVLVSDQLPYQRRRFNAAVAKDHNMVFHFKSQEPPFPPLDEVSHESEDVAQRHRRRSYASH